MKVGIIDYGMGNLGSVRRAFEDLGASVVIAKDPSTLDRVDRVVLPGVGAFCEGMAQLNEGGWIETLRRFADDHERCLLGICLGMQMLADAGDEGGSSEGLGLIGGRIRRLDHMGCTLRIPHVGWNELIFDSEDPLFSHIPQRADFYFVHSYVFDPASPDIVIAHTDYGPQLVAAVRRGNVFGTQFHPEKSSKAGRQLLKNFLNYSPC